MAINGEQRRTIAGGAGSAKGRELADPVVVSRLDDLLKLPAAKQTRKPKQIVGVGFWRSHKHRLVSLRRVVMVILNKKTRPADADRDSAAFIARKDVAGGSPAPAGIACAPPPARCPGGRRSLPDAHQR
jgi:hypothetical protein